MTKFKIGDKLRRVSPTNLYFTKGCAYEISDIREGRLYVHDDFNTEHGMRAKFASEHFELVVEPTEGKPVESTQDVIDLLANISRRLYEAEQAIEAMDKPSVTTFDLAELNGKHLRIYTGDDVGNDYRTSVTVGIDDDTGVMYVLGTRLEVLG